MVIIWYNKINLVLIRKEGKVIRLTNARHAEFNTHQSMMGDIYAKRQLEKTVAMLKKYAKSPAQKKLAKIAFADSSDWGYWANEISDKYIAMVRYALRRVDNKSDAVALWDNIAEKHSMLKTRFLRYLEYNAMKNDRETYRARYVNLRGYLMDAETAASRFEIYCDMLVNEFEAK